MIVNKFYIDEQVQVTDEFKKVAIEILKQPDLAEIKGTVSKIEQNGRDECIYILIGPNIPYPNFRIAQRHLELVD